MIGCDEKPDSLTHSRQVTKAGWRDVSRSGRLGKLERLGHSEGLRTWTEDQGLRRVGDLDRSRRLGGFKGWSFGGWSLDGLEDVESPWGDLDWCGLGHS